MARRPDGSYEFGDFDSQNPQFHARQAREQQERQQAEQVAAHRRRNDDAVARQNEFRQTAQQPVYYEAAPRSGRRSVAGRLIVIAVAILVVGWLFSPPSHWLHALLTPHR